MKQRPPYPYRSFSPTYPTNPHTCTCTAPHRTAPHRTAPHPHAVQTPRRTTLTTVTASSPPSPALLNRDKRERKPANIQPPQRHPTAAQPHAEPGARLPFLVQLAAAPRPPATTTSTTTPLSPPLLLLPLPLPLLAAPRCTTLRIASYTTSPHTLPFCHPVNVALGPTSTSSTLATVPGR